MNEKTNVKDNAWRTQNSLWMVWVFIPLCNFLAFLWIGARAKTKKWVFFAVLYFAVNTGLLMWFFRGDANWMSLAFALGKLGIVVLGLAVYIYGIVHAFITRSEYLRRYAAVLDANESAAMQAKNRRDFFGDTDKDEAPKPQKLALEAGYKMMREMYDLYQSMQDTRLKDEMAEIYETAEKIYKYIAANPESAGKIRKFNEYYFPEVLRMLHEYQKLLNLGEGADIGGKVEKLLQAMIPAFKNQLENLRSDKALDMQTDMAVIEQMAKRDGLADSDM